MGDLIIRKATIEDAVEKGYVHYKSWHETYTGLFPAEVMDKVTQEGSIKIAREHPENTFVAIYNKNIVGFASFLESVDDDQNNTGEIRAIYVLKEYQHLGIGNALIEQCYRELKDFSNISVWVLGSNNNAINFYKSQGFLNDGKTRKLYNLDVIRMIKSS